MLSLILILNLLTFSKPEKLSCGQRVIISKVVLDRNGEITVQTEDGSFEGVKLDKLLWVDHFSKSSPITHNLRSCTVTAKDSKHFTGVRQ